MWCAWAAARLQPGTWQSQRSRKRARRWGVLLGFSAFQVATKYGARWGGWVVGLGPQQLYFPGDTSYVAQLFQDLRARVGEIQLAALPIGAYSPREWMRFEHLDPDEAVLAHLDLGAVRSIGVHWATFQLGDEEPYQPALDLAQAVQGRAVEGFDVVPIGQVVDVPEPTRAAIAARPSHP